MSKHIATRDIKFGTVDGDRWVRAGDEIDEGQLKDFPPSTYRTIDEKTFPDGRCPTCGTVIPTTLGQAGVPPKPVDQPPSTQKDAPQGEAARQAALDSMRMRPDNAESGLPSFGKIPIDVENSFVQGRATQQVRRDPTTAAAAPGATGGQFVPTRGQPNPNPDQRRASAEAAPKPNAGEPNMGGFGAGGETAGASGAAGAGTTTGSAAGTGDVISTGAAPNANQPGADATAQQQGQTQPGGDRAADTSTASVPSGRRGSGSANKP